MKLSKMFGASLCRRWTHDRSNLRYIFAATRTVPTSSFSTRSTCWNENLSGCQPPGCARSKPTASTEQLLFLWNSFSLRNLSSLLWNSLNWAVPPTEQLDKAATALGPSHPHPVFPSQPECYVRRPPMVTSQPLIHPHPPKFIIVEIPAPRPCVSKGAMIQSNFWNGNYLSQNVIKYFILVYSIYTEYRRCSI